MALYAYKGVDGKGRVVTGKVYADNLLEVENRLAKSSIDFINGKPVKQRSFGRRKNLSRKELITLFFQLEQLTSAGVPLIDSLTDLRNSATEKHIAEILAGILENIEGGKKFSEALSIYERDFDQVTISLIAVGEEAGELPKILADIARSFQWEDEMSSKAVKMAIYPGIVGFVILGVATFLMIYLVPQIVPFIQDMGTEIPGYTLALIATSEFFSNYWWAIFTAPFLLTVIMKYLGKTSEKFRYHRDKLLLKVPLTGSIIFKLKLARFSSYLALLYASGVTIIRSLEICKALINNTFLESKIGEIQENISSGNTISESFMQVGFFPPFVIRMIKVGESTGNFDNSLKNISLFYDREVKELIEKIEPTINPLLTVILGGLLGWILFSVLGPVYDTFSNIGV